MNKQYIIKKVLSNNVVLVEERDKNYIFVGKGIGFGKRSGELLENASSVEQKFISLEGLQNQDYELFLETLDPRIIEVCQKINEMARETLGHELASSVYVGLMDHISFAIKRLKDGIEIVNPFLHETRLLYPQEYRLAQKAVEMLMDTLGIEIPEAEIGFLALHFHGGRGDRDKVKALERSMLMNKLIKVVEKKLAIQLEKDSFDYKRLFVHLSGIIDRIEENRSVEDAFAMEMKTLLPWEYKIAFDLSKMIQQTIRKPLPPSELGYLAIHLHKLRGIYPEDGLL